MKSNESIENFCCHTAAKEMILRRAGALGRGRTPFATVDIKGKGERGEIRGSADFYYTPLGMLVCASVKGLGRENGKRGGVYSLSFGERPDEAGMSCAIPPLYERGGYAWCSALTAKISPCEILGKRVTLVDMRKETLGARLATGTVRSAI